MTAAAQAFANGTKARQDGYARHCNPVAYTGADGRYSTVQASIRDAWFAGWDGDDVRVWAAAA